MVLTALVLLISIACGSARLVDSIHAINESSYDFVVVGAGTAGNVLVNRLTANPNVSVLVIESGENDDGVEGLIVPFLAPDNLSNTSLIWNYTTVPQTALDNRTLAYQRGRVLGGSSSINFMFYTRGPRADFDRFANFSGDEGWSWDSVFPFMLEDEDLVPPVDGHDTAGEFNPAVHGTSGPIQTTLTGTSFPTDSLILQTTSVNSTAFPFNIDVNSGDPLGISWVQTDTGGGIRHSSAVGYLHPVLTRVNLEVIANAHVTRLLNIKSRQEPDMRGVAFYSRSGFVVYARKEVILAAGAINTPQLLMLSGIGPSAELESLGITPVIDSPAVGQHMQDHPLFAVVWSSPNSSFTLDASLRNTTFVADALEEWVTSKTGLFSGVGTNLFGWFRFPPSSNIFSEFKDPAAGPTAPHVEIIFNALQNQFRSFAQPIPDKGSYLTATLAVSSPASRGSVKLTSSNPFTFPAIDPGFLTHPYDLAAMIEAIHIADDFFSQSPWADLQLLPFGAFANATTDDLLASMIRSEVTTFWHPCCTARMGANSDSSAVVDSNLLVKGVNGLRVVDASVMASLTAHLQAPVYAIAERGAALVKLAWDI
ncbi:aryl-alcohol oxidase-like protein [Vararia minispora EC-137]|uniref:Aryl-alcohol oxidase-like protein n=1 Tax=Vararia minispora EC-137 TaxID=1314806 RepID=A0ACB8QNJ8_9AGAM|nr:aryl-alcohol oxidase-like protein [Vararia minispora EC-137]